MLTLLSYIYRLIWAIRKGLYDRGLKKIHKLPCPVICVGNLTTGGTGKTPVVIRIAQFLKERYPLSILSRGYKRQSKAHVVVVSDGTNIVASPSEAGDEPYMIARRLRDVPVLVGKRRYDLGLYGLDCFKSRLFILDDGYQHFSLHRDINILLIDGTHDLQKDYLLPRGSLREPLTGICRADCVIITRADEGNWTFMKDMVIKYNKHAPIFKAHYVITTICDQKENHFPWSYIKDKHVFIFSGIGNPGSFRRTMEKAGAIVKGELRFPDHYWYREEDLKDIMDQAYKAGADIVLTTEKDAVRLEELKGDFPVLIPVVDMKIEDTFYKWLSEKI